MYFPDHHAHLSDFLSQMKDRIGKGKTNLEHFEHFKLRLSANYHSLLFLLDQLYGGRHNTKDILSDLLQLLADQYIGRSTDLRELDRVRELDRNWLLSEKWAGMMLYVDHFSGDLTKFKKKIPYFEELGINWIHLMPLLKSPEGENDGGYAVSDYRTIEPSLGTMEDIRDITAEFRGKGMLLAIDYVMNHTADDHAWALNAQKGDPAYQEYFFMFDSREIPDQFEQTMPEVFPDAAPGNFTFDENTGKWVMTQFHHYQWDLNYYNPRVLIEMIDAAFYLANQGIDILRLDAVPFIWKKLGTACRNEYEAHVILRIFKACFEVVAPGVVFIAEAIVRPHEIMGYFGEGNYNGKECDIAYNATLMALCWEALATGETKVLRRVMANIPTKPFGTTWINYLRSHDDIGLGFDDEDLQALGIESKGHRKFIIDYYTGNFPGSMATGAPFASNPKTGDARISGTLSALSGLEKAIELGHESDIAVAIDRILMLQALVFAYGGLPMIYSGGEIGLPNDYDFMNHKSRSYDNRWMHRPHMDWEKAKLRTKEGTIESRLFQGIKKIIEIRKASPELADLNSVSLENCENKHIFSFLRWRGERKMLVLANFFNGTQFCRREIVSRMGMDPDKLLDKLTGEKPIVHHDLLEFSPYRVYWLTENN